VILRIGETILVRLTADAEIEPTISDRERMLDRCEDPHDNRLKATQCSSKPPSQ
jgi:hypothetical protein